MKPENQLGLPLPLDPRQVGLIRTTLDSGNFLVTLQGTDRFEFCDQLVSMGLMTKIFCKQAMKAWQFSVTERGMEWR